MCSCSLFFSLPPNFTLVATSISHFLTATVNFHVFSSNEIGLRRFLISRFSSFSLFHVDIDIKIQSKESLDFVVVFLLGCPEGNAQSRSTFVYVEKRQNGGRNSQKALRIPFRPFLRGRDGSFQPVQRTYLKVCLERTQNYLALYLRRMII